MNQQDKRIPLHAFHAERGAKFVSFGGWEMPVSYGPIMEEHRATREAVGLFDVSHMGEIEIKGKDALRFLNYALVNDVSRAGIGGATYSPMCKEDGGVVDDLITYQLEEEVFLLCVNAANTEKDFQWLKQLADGFTCTLRDLSDQFGLLAIQGPLATNLLQRITDYDLELLSRFRFARAEIGKREVICSRTGYTGEDGFELYCSDTNLESLAIALMEAGESEGLRLVGLGARDSLRLEAGYPLYGHEIDEAITPLQGGLGWTVKWDKGAFMGREALLAEREEGVARRIVHFLLSGRRIARAGEKVFYAEKEVGRVVSGGFSPMLNRPIGSALVTSSVPAEDLYVSLRDTEVALEVKKPPLHLAQG